MNKEQTLLAIDQGTTSSRAILFSKTGDIIAEEHKELKLYYPNKGWVEQDPNDIWNDTLWACHTISKATRTITSIGITNQRETTIIWERETGKPIYNAIVWQDRRTAQHCADLKESGHEETIRARTGLLLDPYFSATKIGWILTNIKGARAKAEAGELAFGTIDTWLLWNLTDGKSHATDATNAARTMLYNIKTHEWDSDLLDIFCVPKALLPEVKDNTADFGQTTKETLTDAQGQTIPISAMAGDQHAALIGQACFKKGMIKATYGTGCFALMNIGQNFKASKNRLLTTIAYRLNGETTYAIEGSIFVAGAAVQWLRDGLQIFKTAAESEALATSVPDNNGVYFVPAFTGLGAPYWNPHARANITGLTRESTAAHITRAALEAQAYQTLDLIDAMDSDTGESPAIIRADGGLTTNRFVCQFLADMLDKPIELPKTTQSTAQGIAYLAGLQAGVYNSLDDISQIWICKQRYTPKMSKEKRDNLYQGWKNAINRLLNEPHQT